jgi:magnesium transporter
VKIGVIAMDNPKKILKKILEQSAAPVAQDKTLQKSVWQAFLDMHPVDIADFLAEIDKATVQKLFSQLPQELQLEVFKEFSNSMKAFILQGMTEPEQVHAFRTLSADELTDLFDFLSDEDLKKYLGLLQKHVRHQVISLMKFSPDSAGGVMHTDVLTLMQDFTVQKSIQILQRLRPSRDIHTRIFIVNQAHKLVGYINLEDLVLHNATAHINSFMHENELVALTTQDQEEVAHKMVHYNLTIAPVTNEEGHFLGAIPASTLVDVLVEEASEDIQKIGAVMPLKHPYFETSFIRVVWARGYILVILLLTGSFSTSILHSYEATLSAFLISFIPMLIGVGGNTSSQTSAVLIQGLAAGEITSAHVYKFLLRELSMAFVLAFFLGGAGFLRVYLTGGSVHECTVISIALALIVIVATTLGSCTPLILKKINIDPAFAAGPFLATIMDIVGTTIFCCLVYRFLF